MLKERRELSLENLALRQQLAVLRRSQTRLKIKQRDRLFWIWLLRTWSGWRAALIIVKPNTVVGWRFSTLIGETIAKWSWWSIRSVTGDPGLDPADGDCQSAVGSTKNSWRVTKAGDQHFGTECFAIDASAS